MFDWLKSKKTEQAQQKQGEETSPSQKLSKDQLIEQAMQNARVAREAIGQETLDRIAAAMQKKQQQQNSPMEQAKKILLSMDQGELSDHLRALRDEDKTTRH